MNIPLWQVDAFTDKPFSGNSAAVCLLDQFPCDDWMQNVASEMNLSDTAFLVSANDANEFQLRWFTPTTEVELCGHATLASAHVLFEQERVKGDAPIRFETRSGFLTCIRHALGVEMNFPATPASEVLQDSTRQRLESILGTSATFAGRSREDILFVMDDAKAVRELAPDFEALAQIETRGLIVTAESSDPSEDFVSRFFAPRFGIDEDPVTGSAHCCLAPYWSDRLGRLELTGRQVSCRSGVVQTRLSGDRVHLSGNAITVFSAQLRV